MLNIRGNNLTESYFIFVCKTKRILHTLTRLRKIRIYYTIFHTYYTCYIYLSRKRTVPVPTCVRTRVCDRQQAYLRARTCEPDAWWESTRWRIELPKRHTPSHVANDSVLVIQQRQHRQFARSFWPGDSLSRKLTRDNWTHYRQSDTTNAGTERLACHEDTPTFYKQQGQVQL